MWPSGCGSLPARSPVAAPTAIPMEALALVADLLDPNQLVIKIQTLLLPTPLPGSTGGAQCGEHLAGQPLDLFVLAGPDRDEVHGGEAERGEGA